MGKDEMIERKSHLDIESPEFEGIPHIWIQWKGTTVCADIHCACGAHLHNDGDFMYFVKCPHCRKVWEVGTHIKLYEPQYEPEEFQIVNLSPDDEDFNIEEN